MSRRVLTSDVTVASHPATAASPCYPVSVTWKKGSVVEVAPGSALETEIGAGNLRATADADVLTSGPRSN